MTMTISQRLRLEPGRMSLYSVLSAGLFLCLLTRTSNALSSSARISSNNNVIPTTLEPPSGILAAAITDAWKSPDGPRIMTPIDFGYSENSVQTRPAVTVTDMISKHAKECGSIAFVVRRPGCVLCREEGQALSKLVAQSATAKMFGVFGIIKEIGVDDEGLLDFFSQYFPYPLYLDQSKQFYKALGSREMSLPTLNPFKLWSGFQDLTKRMEEKDLTGNMKGEGLIQGGVIILDKQGQPLAVYQEETGQQLPVEDILAALKAVATENV